MGYRKFREQREAKTRCPVEAAVIEEREVAKNEITSRLKQGESPIFLAVEYGYNAVVKACHTRKRRRMKRSEMKKESAGST